MKTPKDIVEFFETGDCYENCFKGWTREQLLVELSRAMVDKTFAWYLNPESDEIEGVAIGKLVEGKRIMHIVALMVTSRIALAHLIAHFTLHYPLHILQGNRDGSLVRYNLKNINLMYKFAKRKVLAQS